MVDDRATQQAIKRPSRFERLYEAFSGDAVRFATALTGDPNLASDIVQTAFLRLFSKYRDLRNPDAFYSYLRQTIVNLVRDGARKSATERATLSRHGSANGRLDQADFAEEVDARHEMAALINELPQRQRTVLVLRYFEDLSEDETAVTMGISVSAIKSLTNRAVTNLRERTGERHEH